jgi:hypothetical protein
MKHTVVGKFISQRSRNRWEINFPTTVQNLHSSWEIYFPTVSESLGNKFPNYCMFFTTFAARISVHDKKGCDTMGERIGRIGRIETDFFGFFTDSKHMHPRKNPFQSARSAQSVLPSYHTFFCHVLSARI